ncbi:minor capsid protein [Actinoplanes sp. NPDC049599]|uniref:phage tail terminator protein n=1 Tax=Actinoplanes sp. NPDC049599 TaxID=3363903 RepID=UPI003792F0D8
MSGFTSTLLTSLAEALDTAGIGVWRPTGPYTADEVAIAIRGIPPAPDRLITLSTYRIGDDYPGEQDFVQMVQARFRGSPDPRVVDDLGDAVFELLDSREHWELGPIHVVYSQRRSDTVLGQDGSRRWEISHNYALHVMRPTAHRTV